jgi:hypothetical protein
MIGFPTARSKGMSHLENTTAKLAGSLDAAEASISELRNEVLYDKIEQRKHNERYGDAVGSVTRTIAEIEAKLAAMVTRTIAPSEERSPKAPKGPFGKGTSTTLA